MTSKKEEALKTICKMAGLICFIDFDNSINIRVPIDNFQISFTADQTISFILDNPEWWCAWPQINIINKTIPKHIIDMLRNKQYDEILKYKLLL